MLVWSRKLIWYLASRVTVGVILLVAIYASLGQYYAPLAASYKTPILEFLNRYSPVEIEAEDLTVSWQRLSPILSLQDVRIRRDTDNRNFIAVSQLSASINVLASIRDRGVRLDHLSVSGMSLDVLENSRQLKSDQGDVPWRELWLQFLSTLEYADMIVVEKGHIVTALGELDLFFELGRNDNFRRLNGQLVLNQAPLSFVVETNGSLVDAESLRGKAYFKAADVNFDRLGLDNVLEDNPLPADLSATTEVWMDWHPTRGITAQGSFSIPRIDLSKLYDDVGNVERVSSNFILSYQSPQQWDLSLSNTAFDFYQPFNQEAMRVIMGRENDQPLLTISAPSLDLQQLHGVVKKVPALNNTAILNVLNEMSPQGKVSGLNLAVPLQDLAATRFSGRLQNVSILSYQKLPSGRNISGVVRGTALSGSLNISSEDFQLSLPSTYENPLDYARFQGDFKWRKDEQGFVLRSNRFTLSGDDGAISGYLGLHFPPADHPYLTANMDLLVGLQGGQVTSVGRYLPFKMNENLKQWLVSSLKAGHVDSASVLYRGSIVAGSDAATKTLQMNYVTRDATLQYSPDWPALRQMDAVVNVDDVLVDVAMSQAESHGVSLSNVVATSRATDDFASWLAIEGSLAADSGNVVGLLLDSPLKDSLAEVLTPWQASGASVGQLKLGLPLSGEKPIKEAYTIDVKMALQDNVFHQPTARLSFSDINGSLRYRQDEGLSSRLLRGRFLGQEVTADIASERINGVWLPQLNIEGSLDMRRFGDWMRSPVFDFVQGVTPMKAQINNRGNGTLLTFTSSLHGVTVELPSPLAKSSVQTWPLQGELSLNSGKQYLSVDIENVLDMNAQLTDFSVEGVQLALNADADSLPELPGVYLTGEITSLVLGEWQPVINHYASNQSGDKPSMRMGLRNLHVGTIDIFGYELKGIDAFGDSVLDFWHFYVDDDVAKGTAAFYSDGRPPRVALEYLDLTPFFPVEDDLVAFDDAAFWESLNFDDFPSIDISIARLVRAENELGNWSFDLRSSHDQLSLENVIAEKDDLIIEGSSSSLGANFFWQRGDNPLTRLDGVFRLGDLAQHMEAIGIPPTMTSERGSFDIQAQWPGKPTDYNAQTLSGKVKLNITNGLFLNVPDSASSALNITNLFNFGALVQRLKLDFSDLTSGGVRYDNVLGEMNFANGTMQIADSIEIEGPSSEFSISGSADLQARDVDLSLVAVLPITGNISLITAATANLPAAVGVFVVSKLFKKQFDKLSSVVYHITGPWDDPVIEFNKLFDVGELPSQQGAPR